MNQVLKLIQERELYVHLILFKVYLNTKGRTDKVYSGNLTKELTSLFESEFNREYFDTALQYLFTEGYTKYTSAQTLTVEGRRYFEQWIQEFAKLDESEKKLLNEKLPSKIKDFLGITKDAIVVIKTAVDFFNNLN